jgi:hypothetical protein
MPHEPQYTPARVTANIREDSRTGGPGIATRSMSGGHASMVIEHESRLMEHR